MNPYYYLFYKLSRFLNKKGNNEMGSIYAITIILLMNIVFIYVKSFHITRESSHGLYKVILGIVIVCVFTTNAILFQNKNRVKEIMDRYKNESDTSRKTGNFLVILYVVLSLALIVFV
jgi:uncharacterized membrane protein YidH (DUF202 family)